MMILFWSTYSTHSRVCSLVHAKINLGVSTAALECRGQYGWETVLYPLEQHFVKHVMKHMSRSISICCLMTIAMI